MSRQRIMKEIGGVDREAFNGGGLKLESWGGRGARPRVAGEAD